jgi:hypothetical protein
MDLGRADFITELIMRFTQLQEQWQSDPNAFEWSKLDALAREGASAYNDQAGPAFHALALDGVLHSEFHERFLGYALEAGFDPFKVEKGASDDAWFPVIDHQTLEAAARSNPVSARMHERLKEIAKLRFEPLAKDIEQGADKFSHPMFRAAEACAESIPAELLARIAPELVRHSTATFGSGRPDTEESFLSTAEQIIDSRTPYG